MDKISVAKVLGIGAVALAFGGVALAASIPPKPPRLSRGPHARFVEVRPDLPRTGGPLPVPGKAQPIPNQDTGNQLLGGKSSGPVSATRLADGPGTALGGAAVVAPTPQMRLENSLGRIAKELR